MPIYENAETTIKFKYREFFQPKSESELVDFLSEAYKRKRRIKVNGGSHTFSNIKNTQDTLLDLSALKNYTRLISIDEKTQTARMGAGMVIADAIEALYKNGWNFPVLGGWYGQTLGGAIATSTHGSCLNQGTLSDTVVELKAILASGEKIHLKEGDEELLAWRTHLGQLGIVTEIVLKVEPLFYLESKVENYEDDRDAFEELFFQIKNWDQAETPYINLLWLPYYGSNGRALIRKLYKKSVSKPNQRALEYEETALKKDGKILKYIYEDRATLTLSRAFLLQPHKMKNLWSNIIASSFLKDEGALDRSFRILCHSQFREPTKNHRVRLVLNVEIGVDALVLEDVFWELRSLLKSRFERGLVLNYPRIQVRFSDSSDKSWLGTNAGRKTAYISTYISAAASHKKQIPLARDFERILDKYGGRPHWGKFRYLEDDRNFLNTYSGNYEKFLKYRRRVDPEGLFSDGMQMYKNLDMLKNVKLLKNPFSGLNPNNYFPIRYLGGKSRDLVL